MEFSIERDILMTLNPNLKYNDFNVLEKVNTEFDLLGITDFEFFILEEDLDQILSRAICDYLPYRVMENKNFEINKIVRYDSELNRVIALSDTFWGGIYIKEQIEKMNKLLNNGESKA